jgi:3-(methylthio)propanoyl-CoA dehydrogenase
MPDYTPPLDDMIFTLTHLVGYGASPGAQIVDVPMAETILGEAGKLASEVLAPLSWAGDRAGCKWDNGVVKTAPGWREAYAAYRDGGWNAVPFDPEFGGQGLPWAIAFPVQEMWQAANMSFGLCPLLNQGAVEAIASHGSLAQKQTYLPKLVSGEWTGTMNLTEPSAGSDLGAVATKAIKQNDGSYKISGQKIFITYGEHDLADNIIHLVLARTPDAPAGPKGISLFIMPKILSDGFRNDVKCVSIEHKLGIHASPTCTMVFGDAGGATGYLVGAENEGLKYMFTMMNNARLSVGLQGVAIANRATQAAIAYATDRVQGKPVKAGPATISGHADVKRMLLTMQALTFAARAITYDAAIHLDRAHAGDAAAQDRVDLMTPVVKGWGTEIAQIVTSLGVQVHGGMGFVEETGVAQYLRDARILPIYEGTNGIQAADLTFRKVIRNDGVSVTTWLRQASAVAASLGGDYGAALTSRLQDLRISTENLVKSGKNDADTAAALSTPYLHQFGYIAGGVMMARVLAADDAGIERQNLARYYLDQLLPHADVAAAQQRGDMSVITAVTY